MYARPRAINAGTTYGVDGSAGNNYGLGRSYQSTATKAKSAKVSASTPSWIWLVAIIILGVVYL